MKIIVLCVALAAFCACATAQVATPIKINGAPAYAQGNLVHAGETWFIGRQSNNYRTVLRTDAVTGRPRQVAGMHFDGDYYKCRVCFEALGGVFYQMYRNGPQDYGLWFSRGTPETEVPIAFEGRAPHSFFEMNGFVYYMVTALDSGQTLVRRTSGRELDAETVIQMDDYADVMDRAGDHAAVLDSDNVGFKVLATDGVSPAVEILSMPFNLPAQLGNQPAIGAIGTMTGELYFWIHDVDYRLTIYKSGGTAGTTVALSQPTQTRDWPKWRSARQVGGVLCFLTDNYVWEPTRLIRTDGTSAGTFDLGAAVGVAAVGSDLVVHDGRVWFVGLWQNENWLFSTDGTVAGTAARFRAPQHETSASLLLSCAGRLFYQTTYVDLGRSRQVWQANVEANKWIEASIHFEQSPTAEFVWFVGESGGKPLISDEQTRMWRLDLEQGHPSYTDEGCAASASSGLPALALACMMLPWLRRLGGRR